MTNGEKGDIKPPEELKNEIQALNKKYLAALAGIEKRFTMDGLPLVILKYCATTIPHVHKKTEIKCYLVEVTYIYGGKVFHLYCTPPSCVE